MAHGDGPQPDGKPLVDNHRGLPRPLMALRTYLPPLLAKRFGRGTSGPTKLSGTARELEAISIYARFAARHPEMPFYHRERILLQILRCCEDARAGLP